MKKYMCILAVVVPILLPSYTALAFTSADIFEAIVASHPGDKTLRKIEAVSGSNNVWTMLVQTRTAPKDDGQKEIASVPTTLRYSGSKIYVFQELAEVDPRVVEAVFDDGDVESKIEDLAHYDAFSSELTGFKSKVTYDGKHMHIEGSVSVAGKKFAEVKELLVDMFEELTELYYEVDVANGEALEDYFEMVLDKEYAVIRDAQTFVEVVGHGFTQKNQVHRRESEIGHWAWHVGEVNTETVNHGRQFEEILLLATGQGLSEYKQEKMYAELEKRVRSHLPKGSKTLLIRPHPVKMGQTAVVLQYPLFKEPDGEDIRGYHEKFIKFVTKVYPSLTKITGKYTTSAVSQEIKSLTAQEFMDLMNDGLDTLPLYEEEGASGQWKFKYKNVAYIITNYKKYMSLSFIAALPKGRIIDDIIETIKRDIDQNFQSFVEKYEVVSYKGSNRTVWVKMRFNYGMLTSSEITGKRLKEKYHQFINDIAPELKSRI